MFYTLVLLACLSSAPQACEQHEVLIGDLATHPGTAFMQAQPIVARWIDTHPGYFVQRWRLMPGRAA